MRCFDQKSTQIVYGRLGKEEYKRFAIYPSPLSATAARYVYTVLRFVMIIAVNMIYAVTPD